MVILFWDPHTSNLDCLKHLNDWDEEKQGEEQQILILLLVTKRKQINFNVSCQYFLDKYVNCCA